MRKFKRIETFGDLDEAFGWLQERIGETVRVDISSGAHRVSVAGRLASVRYTGEEFGHPGGEGPLAISFEGDRVSARRADIIDVYLQDRSL